MSASTARRFSYAPEDPTLPKPWKGLVDGTTGYLYFWNTETNVTQYERPVCKFDAGLPAEEPAAVSEEPLSTVDGGGEENTFPRNGAGGAEENSFPRNGDGDGVENSHPVATRRNPGSNCQVSRDMPSNMPAQSASLNAHSSNSEGSLSAESYRRKHEITVMGGDIPVPFMTFDVTGFPSLVLKQIHDAGFSAPTPIQAQSWPIALQGRDIVAVAKTGSGKTLGFLFPGFMHVGRLRNNRKLGPTMLILSPTRELATQIFDEAVKFGTSAIACTCLYGGASKGPQLRDIDRGVDVVVATPGRLNDILEMKRISLHQVSYLVLDEADRMLDMGFEPQIRKIVKEVTSRRQTLMFTATWPKVVRKIASDLLSNPVQVNIGNIDELVANKSITQYVEVMPSNQKRRRLEEILRSQEPGSKIIIFCSTKRMCDMLVQDLASKIGAAAIHGDKSQDERDRVLSQFRTGRSPVLVATDVAARGLDVKDIRVVINYDFPTGVEDYVHRIGRTGRGGATGISYTFFSDQDSKYAADLIKVLEGASQQVPSELHDMASRGSGGYGKFSRWGSGNDNTMRSYGDRSDSCQPSHGGYYSGGSRCQQGKPDSIDRRGYNSGPSTDATFSQDVPRSRSRSPPFRHADPTPAGGRWPSQHWDNC